MQSPSALNFPSLKRSSPVVKAVLSGLSFALVGASTFLAKAQSVVQEYYVPMPEAELRQSFLVLASNTGSTMDSVVSIMVGSPDSIVVYDHWEDGYEPDLDAPSQATTQVWGDGVNANGIAPGFATDPPGLAEGTVIALRNLVTLPRNPSAILYDGRDRVGATKGIVMSRSAWATTPGPVLADATEVSATIDWGTSFVMPVGEDEIFPTPLTSSMFELVSLFVQAAENGTTARVHDHHEQLEPGGARQRPRARHSSAPAYLRGREHDPGWHRPTRPSGSRPRLSRSTRTGSSFRFCRAVSSRVPSTTLSVAGEDAFAQIEGECAMGHTQALPVERVQH